MNYELSLIVSELIGRGPIVGISIACFLLWKQIWTLKKSLESD
jgi:hypothetical protein